MTACLHVSGLKSLCLLLLVVLLGDLPFSKTCIRRQAQNCRDIYNLLQQEDCHDFDLKAGWDRRSPGVLSLPDSNLGTPSKASPLPPISRIEKKSGKNSDQCEPARSPSWSRVESCDLSFLEEGQDRTDTLDKWLRSSRPANTLPKLERKLNV